MMNDTNERRSPRLSQQDLIARYRSDSCTDPSVPLYFSAPPHPIIGPTAAQWFREKKRREQERSASK